MKTERQLANLRITTKYELASVVMVHGSNLTVEDQFANHSPSAEI